MIVQPKAEIKAEFVVTLTEAEARALVALSDYGANAFFRAYQEKLGSRLNEHEAGLNSLMACGSQKLAPAIKAVGDSRKSIFK